jgi:Zn-dependent protease with chaperone function
MSIASIRFATHTRTWLLIAAVTALLIGIGALLGRAFLYLFAGLAAAMNVIGYWFSDRFALKAGRTQPVAPGTMPELEAMVQDLTRRAQVPAPRLVHDPVGAAEPVRHRRNPQHAPVAVTEGLLQHLPPDQVKSVLAHEFGHIKNRATSSSRRSPRWWQGRSRRSRRSTPSTHWHGRVWRPSSRRIRRLPGAHAGCGRSTMTWPSPSPHRVVA